MFENIKNIKTRESYINAIKYLMRNIMPIEHDKNDYTFLYLILINYPNF